MAKNCALCKPQNFSPYLFKMGMNLAICNK